MLALEMKQKQKQQYSSTGSRDDGDGGGASQNIKSFYNTIWIPFAIRCICFQASKHADWCGALYASSRSKDASLSTLLLFLPESNIIMMILIKYNLYQYYLSTS